MIKFLGNKKAEIKEIFKSFRHYKNEKHILAWVNYNNYWVKKLNIATEQFFKSQRTYKLFGGGGNSDSVFSPKILLDVNCTAWHIDGTSHDMLICSYPNPTQILIPKTEAAFYYNKQKVTIRCAQQNEAELAAMIEENQFEVFEPEVGDVLYISTDTIHRTNPKSWGKRHLCLRIHQPKEIKNLS